MVLIKITPHETLLLLTSLIWVGPVAEFFNFWVVQFCCATDFDSEGIL